MQYFPSKINLQKSRSLFRLLVKWSTRIIDDIKVSFLIRISDLIPISHQGIGIRIKNLLFKASGIQIGHPAFIDHGFRILFPRNVKIGHCCSLGHDNHIWAFTPVVIGHHTITAKELLIISGSHDTSTFAPLDDQEVIIGPGCWIGARVTILGGVKIGRGCVIGAGSLVNKSIPDWSIVAGVPAKVIRERVIPIKIWNHFGWYDKEELKM